jgi:kynurenine formamidase
MSTIIDLSQIIEDSMPVYPGDDRTILQQSRSLAKDHYNDHRLTISMHAGTHLDGPMHLTESGKYVSDINIESFMGDGCLLDVRNQPVIGMKKEFLSLIPERSIVLLFTAWDRFYGHSDYYENHPVVDNEMCQLFIDKKIKLLGIDAPSPDLEPYPIHKMLLRAGIYVVENLTNLEKIPLDRKFEVIALPLKIKSNGSMARVIARI